MGQTNRDVLSIELRNTDYGYKTTFKKHLFYMDDLKLYKKNDHQENQSKAVNRFGNDIGIQFYMDKSTEVTFKKVLLENSKKESY